MELDPTTELERPSSQLDSSSTNLFLIPEVRLLNAVENAAPLVFWIFTGECRSSLILTDGVHSLDARNLL